MTKKKRIPTAKIDDVAAALHQLISYTTLAALTTANKLADPTITEELRTLELGIADSMLETAQTLYEDLDKTQRKFLRTLARAIIENI